LEELNLMELLFGAARFLTFYLVLVGTSFSFIASFLILSAHTQEAGVFFGFVEFEDHAGINNALNVSIP
jgi:hypothetical protein